MRIADTETIYVGAVARFAISNVDMTYTELVEDDVDFAVLSRYIVFRILTN